ncbi:unnamed protein product [Protopolystoma xenopodis]|uniref:Uncharacterized protein n=1 Tax=Protopolystoma xenopodis TaxID=117903 RepID=A0A3S5CR72_9PLAT|nr:unnamed protein product [Protopolystoma xenopodis]
MSPIPKARSRLSQSCSCPRGTQIGPELNDMCQLNQIRYPYPQSGPHRHENTGLGDRPLSTGIFYEHLSLGHECIRR